jgi:hypothetical protein
MASRALCRVVWIPSGLALIGTVAAFAIQPHPVPAPGKLMTFTSMDKTLSVDHPANWQSQSMSVGGNSAEVTYQPTKNVMIRFGTDLQGSLMADIVRAPAPSMDTSSLPPEMANQFGGVAEKRKTPLENLHEMESASFAKEFEGYQEGKTTHTRLAGLEALATDFTCQVTDLFTKRQLVGRRYTALSNERRVTATYYLPKESEEKLGPTLRKMVNSLRVGQQGG